MNKKQLTSNGYFTSLQIVYFALIAGQILCGLVSLYVHQSTEFDSGGLYLRDIFIFIVPLLVIGGVFGSKIVFRVLLKVSKNKTSLIEKMYYYRVALIARYALLEGSSFFSIVVYLLTGDILFLGMSGLIIVVFFTIKPTKNKAVNDLELSPDDEQLINDPNMIIAEVKRETY